MASSEVIAHRLRCVLPFEAVPAEVRLLRRAATRQLDCWGAPTIAEEVELLVSELATNVIKHVGRGAPATLVLEMGESRLRLEVHDKSDVVPVQQSADCGDECGRGLHLLAAMAADWGIVLTAAGKAVWCEIDLNARSGCRRMERAVLMLEAYQEVRGAASGPLVHSRDVGLRESAVELIADLLHWTATRGFDPEDILDQAQMHYEAAPDVAA
ncbi:ATP-binding protein [Streptomyces sp. 15-116A]|uniref:ATP-binding protein n=1 Tax=Streptomyces sp. 15-116A TaxID=2259035 RepID=UPI0021B24418|nr:ATP-binding protein [Streptomyces sp. 15-116A]MCT7351335.1 ATP-binding protein [Streptomyces sp. 15-116A]